LIPKESAKFIKEKYLPELEKSVSEVSVTFLDQIDLIRKFIGMIMKILYAFMWQEFFIPLTFLYGDFGLFLGAKATPFFNKISSFISDFPQTDQDVVNSTNLYPG